MWRSVWIKILAVYIARTKIIIWGLSFLMFWRRMTIFATVYYKFLKITNIEDSRCSKHTEIVNVLAD